MGSANISDGAITEHAQSAAQHEHLVRLVVLDAKVLVAVIESSRQALDDDAVVVRIELGLEAKTAGRVLHQRELQSCRRQMRTVAGDEQRRG